MTKLQSIGEHMTTSLRAALTGGRALHSHSTLKGDASEDVWRRWFERHLPKRYAVERAVLIDSKGNESEQIDLVIFDPTYTPTLFNSEYGVRFLPVESVYAVFEVKQKVTPEYVREAQEKARSVRRLVRTNAPIYHAGGKISDPKKLIHIHAGLLALESVTRWPLATDAGSDLGGADAEAQLDVVVVVNDGSMTRCRDDAGVERWDEHTSQNGALYALLQLLQQLARQATVNAIEFDQYLVGAK